MQIFAGGSWKRGRETTLGCFNPTTHVRRVKLYSLISSETYVRSVIAIAVMNSNQATTKCIADALFMPGS